jgi:hypothetical protein
MTPPTICHDLRTLEANAEWCLVDLALTTGLDSGDA